MLAMVAAIVAAFAMAKGIIAGEFGFWQMVLNGAVIAYMVGDLANDILIRMGL
jgi:hypothetical protein